MEKLSQIILSGESDVAQTAKNIKLFNEAAEHVPMSDTIKFLQEQFPDKEVTLWDYYNLIIEGKGQRRNFLELPAWIKDYDKEHPYGKLQLADRGVPPLIIDPFKKQDFNNYEGYSKWSRDNINASFVKMKLHRGNVDIKTKAKVWGVDYDNGIIEWGTPESNRESSRFSISDILPKQGKNPGNDFANELLKINKYSEEYRKVQQGLINAVDHIIG